ncbi:MAG: 4Fe-4S binding protein [Candidatus Helarchaeota archaeon]
MVETSRHPNIELHVYSEIKNIGGSAGRYEVTIERKPTYVDWEKCTGCARCLEKCPVLIPNEFNYGLGTRKAINILHPNAVPKNAYIDMDYCIKCKQCQKTCLAGAIDYEMEATTSEIMVGAIVITTGYETYDIESHGDFGYGKFYNILTQIELERFISPTGPTGGHLYRLSDGKTPKKIAMIQCVGSRDIKTNAYCSGGVCCLVAMKNAQLLVQEYGDEMEISIYYIDIRTTSKDEEEYYARIRGLNPQIRFIKGKVAEVTEDPETCNLILRSEDVISGRIIKEEFDLVVLSTAMVPHPKAKEIGELMGLDKAPSGFFKEIHTCLNPVETKASGVYIGGAARNPMAVPYAVSTARAAAAMAIDFVAAGKFRLELVNPIIDELLCIGCGTCERNCSFGAIKVGEDGIAHVDEIACKGCGVCASSCPVRAITFRYYRDEQIINQIDALVRE